MYMLFGCLVRASSVPGIFIARPTYGWERFQEALSNLGWVVPRMSKEPGEHLDKRMFQYRPSSISISHYLA